MKILKWRWLSILLLGLGVNFTVNQIFSLKTGPQNFYIIEVLEAIVFAFFILEGVRKINKLIGKRISWEASFIKRFFLQLFFNVIYVCLLLNLVGSVYTILVYGENFSVQEMIIINLVSLGFTFLIVLLEAGKYFFDKWQGANQELLHTQVALNDLKQTKESEINKREIITAKLGNKEFLLDIADVISIYTQDKVVFILTKDNKRYISDKSLEQVFQDVGHGFFKANRQFIISLDIIEKFESASYGKVAVHLKENDFLPSQIFVSRIQAATFRKWFKSHTADSISVNNQ